MIRPLIFVILITINLPEVKVISKNILIRPEIKNIIIITLIALILRETIGFKESSHSEKKRKFLVKLIGILVIMSFLVYRPLKFLIMIEMSIYPLAWLILTTSKDKDKRESLKFIILLNTIGSVPFIAYATLDQNLIRIEYNLLDLKRISVLRLVIILFAFKTPIFMLHLWLTKVHVSSSGNCSIILARVIIKLGTVGIIKFTKNTQRNTRFCFFSSLAVLRRIYFGILILRFQDAKTLIAISSILHISVIPVILLTKKSNRMLAAVIMISAHGLISYYLFYLITIKYEKAERRRILFIKSMESINKVLTLIIVTFIFINIGLPPFINFYSETIFLVCLKLSASKIVTIILALSMFLRIVFSIQINTNEIYGKSEIFIKKKINRRTRMNFSIFFMWSLLILWFMYLL